MADAHNEKFDVFLSHSHLDAKFVELIGERLEDSHNFRVWLDKWILVPGNHWQQEMATGLRTAQTCAVCIGSKTPAGWFKEEIGKALNRQVSDNSFRVIPVILPGGNKLLIDDFLDLRTWIEFENCIDDECAFHGLACGIKGIPPGRFPKKKKEDNPETDMLRVNLTKIRKLDVDGLIDKEISLEFQRKLLTQSIGP